MKNSLDHYFHRYNSCLEFSAFKLFVHLLKPGHLTFISWYKDAVYVSGLLVKERTVWLLAAGWLIFPVALDLLPVFLFGLNRQNHATA